VSRLFERLRLRLAEFGWVYKYRRIRFTREGWFFFVVTMAIGFAALNTGHNLFYLIFAMLVSLIVVSGVLSERAVRSLRVERVLPAEVFARSATAVEIRVENRSRRRTAYAVEVRDAVDGEARRRVAFVDRLAPGANRSFHAVWTMPKRGRHELRNVHLVTRFPFGLFEKTRIVPLAASFLAFPAIDRVAARESAMDLSRAALRKHRLGEEILGLRPKLAEDDRRSIHWRVSARVGELMVKEPGEAPDRPVAIFLDDRGPAGPAFEAAVERAAALLWNAEREDRRVSLTTFTVRLACASRESFRRALAMLAEVQPASAPASDHLDRWRTETMRGGGVFVTAGDAPALPAGTLVRVA
jgi:uncharacterized protein (DUF58 family)